jgi:hypothetical protein
MNMQPIIGWLVIGSIIAICFRYERWKDERDKRLSRMTFAEQEDCRLFGGWIGAYTCPQCGGPDCEYDRCGSQIVSEMNRGN